MWEDDGDFNVTRSHQAYRPRQRRPLGSKMKAAQKNSPENIEPIEGADRIVEEALSMKVINNDYLLKG